MKLQVLFHAVFLKRFLQEAFFNLYMSPNEIGDDPIPCGSGSDGGGGAPG